MKIMEVAFNSPQHKRAIRELRLRKPKKNSGRDLAIRALTGSETARIAIATNGSGKIVGATSWRITPEGIKLINAGVLLRRRGIGRALVKFVAKRHPSKPMWLKSLPRAIAFYAGLGMKPRELLSNGWRIFRWTAEEIDRFASS